MMQMLMEAMSLFFPPRGGPGNGAGPQLHHIGTCTCGGMLQLVTDPELQPVLPEVSCTAAGISCTANLPDMPITGIFREFQVCHHLLRAEFVQAACWVARVQL